MMKHIYIFIAVTRGVNYGIGTYIDVLLMSLRSCKLKVTIVELDSFISEVRIVDYKSYRAIKIPYLLTIMEIYALKVYIIPRIT